MESRTQSYGIFNPTRILHSLLQLQRRLNSHLNSFPTLEQYQELLSRISQDPNSRPAESLLSVISLSAGASSVIDTLVVQALDSLFCPEGLIQRFSISDLVVADNTRPLLSLLYYTGALTFNVMPELKGTYFKTPNALAHKEFLQAAQNLLHLKESDTLAWRDGVVAIVEQEDLGTFARALEHSFRRFDGRDVIGGEDALAARK